ncbi:MAG: site-specific integrase, partial [Bifidobacterium crudilactis]|nr:site-specific integrase [Bifidobacterium crudilactis]
MRRADSKTAIRKRRRKGDGGLYEESGQWCAEWHDSENRRHRAYGATPELALARKAKRIQVAFIQPPKPKQRGSIGTASNPTVKQAMETWLLNNENIGETSRGKYRRNLERYVIPYVGNRAVKKLTPDDMETLKTTWKQQHVGQSAMWHVWKTLNTMLNSLVKKGTIQRNPMVQVDAPKRTNRRAEHIEAYISAHTQTALGIIAWTAKEDTSCHRYHSLVMAMALGLRRAEALGITQASLIPSTETLEIRTRLKQKVGGGYYLQP